MMQKNPNRFIMLGNNDAKRRVEELGKDPNSIFTGKILGDPGVSLLKCKMVKTRDGGFYAELRK